MKALDVERSVILKFNTKKVQGCGLDSGQESVAHSCEHGNELFCYIKGREFLDFLSNSCVLKKYSVP
jgi:hypothetical protein